MLHAYVGIFSKLRSLNLLSEPFDEQQFFVNEDEFEQNNNPTGEPHGTNPFKGKRFVCCMLINNCLGSDYETIAK